MMQIINPYDCKILTNVYLFIYYMYGLKWQLIK